MAISSPTQRIASANSSSGKSGGKGDGAGTDDPTAKKGGKSKKKLIIIAVVVLLLGGVGAKMFLLKPAPQGEAKPKPGPIVTMDEMTVNLSDSHFLRLQIALETAAGGGAKEGGATFETAKAAQAIITTFSQRKMTELAGEKAREAAKEELLKALQKAYPKKILDVYYTNFVMQ